MFLESTPFANTVTGVLQLTRGFIMYCSSCQLERKERSDLCLRILKKS